MKPLLEQQLEVLKALDDASALGQADEKEKSERFCYTCRFCAMPQNKIKVTATEALCTSPKASQRTEDNLYRLIDGQPRHVRCFDARLSRDACGEAGVWFERKGPIPVYDEKQLSGEE